LRTAWRADAYTMGRGVDVEHADFVASSSINVGVVDAAVRSDLFWCYAEMLDQLGEILQELTRVLESCPCHHGNIRLEGPTRHLRRNRFLQAVACHACPLSTMWAPELAVGDHLVIVRKLLSMGHTWLLTTPSFVVLTEAYKGGVVKDWAAGRRHILVTLQLKFSFWKQLPWCLFGLGHPKDVCARAAGRRSLALFAAAGDGANHHWLSMTMCAAGTDLHDQVVRYSTGEIERSQAPALCRMAARFRFAPVVERWIEGRHAIAKALTRSSRNASVVHLAYMGVQQSLRRLLATDPGVAKTSLAPSLFLSVLEGPKTYQDHQDGNKIRILSKSILTPPQWPLAFLPKEFGTAK
jgi:hypothetical protein